jgi:hypothetical protein
MAKQRPRTDLTDQQEYAVRSFLDDCVELQISMPQDIIAGLIDRMGYKVITPGKLVRKDREIKFIYGDPDPFRNIEDEYGPDGEALLERLYGKQDTVAGDGDSTDEASPSESPESDPVGDVLQQDV